MSSLSTVKAIFVAFSDSSHAEILSEQTRDISIKISEKMTFEKFKQKLLNRFELARDDVREFCSVTYADDEGDCVQISSQPEWDLAKSLTNSRLQLTVKLRLSDGFALEAIQDKKASLSVSSTNQLVFCSICSVALTAEDRFFQCNKCRPPKDQHFFLCDVCENDAISARDHQREKHHSASTLVRIRDGAFLPAKSESVRSNPTKLAKHTHAHSNKHTQKALLEEKTKKIDELNAQIEKLKSRQDVIEQLLDNLSSPHAHTHAHTTQRETERENDERENDELGDRFVVLSGDENMTSSSIEVVERVEEEEENDEVKDGEIKESEIAQNGRKLVGIVSNDLYIDDDDVIGVMENEFDAEFQRNRRHLENAREQEEREEDGVAREYYAIAPPPLTNITPLNTAADSVTSPMNSLSLMMMQEVEQFQNGKRANQLQTDSVAAPPGIDSVDCMPPDESVMEMLRNNNMIPSCNLTTDSDVTAPMNSLSPIVSDQSARPLPAMPRWTPPAAPPPPPHVDSAVGCADGVASSLSRAPPRLDNFETERNPELRQLFEMGFFDRKRNLDLISKHRGKMDDVIEELLAA